MYSVIKIFEISAFLSHTVKLTELRKSLWQTDKLGSAYQYLFDLGFSPREDLLKKHQGNARDF